MLIRLISLRVSPEDEILGLNLSEHSIGASNEDMISQINDNLRSGDSGSKIVISPESDSHEVALHYNAVVDSFDTLNSQKQEALDNAVFHANHDFLTNLLNRRAMHSSLEIEIRNVIAHDLDCCLALIDIDKFKTINDEHGHDIGDKAIQYTATTIRNFVRKSDIVARAGGEEFCIIFPNTGVNECYGLLEKLRAKLEKFPLYTGDLSVSITVSIGVTGLSKEKTMGQVLKEADIALYRAKKNGRNRVDVY